MAGQAFISSQTLYQQLRGDLSLRQLSNPAGTNIFRSGSQPTAADDSHKAKLVGPLDAIRPYQIQIVSNAEIRYLAGLSIAAVSDLLHRIRTNGSAALILSDGASWPAQHQDALQALPVFESPLSAEQLIKKLHNFLNDQLNEPITVHGALLEVHSTGLLITGPSGIGKSELALELISRGHRYLADDSPFLRRDANDTVHGSCPTELAGFLEVRGLGILNIRRLFGEASVKDSQEIELIIDLQSKSDLPATKPEERLAGRRAHRTLLGIKVPTITMPVVAGRNLAVLVEAAAQDFQLRRNGYSAADDLINIHGRMLRSAESGN